jgi:hypothetical protein
MIELSPGEKVYVPSEVGLGAFPDERLVTVETNEGPVSGFAQESFLKTDGGDNYLLAEVQSVSGQTLTVRLFGSFFTTTGLAYLPLTSPFLRAT